MNLILKYVIISIVLSKEYRQIINHYQHDRKISTMFIEKLLKSIKYEILKYFFIIANEHLSNYICTDINKI